MSIQSEFERNSLNTCRFDTVPELLIYIDYTFDYADKN